MRLAVIVIYVFFIGATGLAAYGAIPNDELYDLNSLYGRDNPALFNHDCRNIQQTTIDSHFVIVNKYLYDDCLFNTQQDSVFLAYDHGKTKWIDYDDDKLIKPAIIDYHAMYTRADFSIGDSDRDRQLINNPSPSTNNYDIVVYWIKEVYHTWLAKDHNGPTRLLLLSFGLVGIIGIRRKFKKR